MELLQKVAVTTSPQIHQLILYLLQISVLKLMKKMFASYSLLMEISTVFVYLQIKTLVNQKDSDTFNLDQLKALNLLSMLFLALN